LIVEGNENKKSRANITSGTVTCASVELLECLVDKKAPSQTASVDYVDVS